MTNYVDPIEILLVEDNPRDAELTKRALKKQKLANHLVVIEDGAEAVDFIFRQGKYKDQEFSNSPKLILLDVKLPKLTGLEVLQRIKSNPMTRLIPVVMVTSSGEDPDIQRAYELLFNFAFTGAVQRRKNYIVVNTPVDIPVPNYAVHKVPSIDKMVADSVMCVMLRGALLPSMILSKEIQEYSSNNYLTPFALFKISRDETKNERNMEYILDLDRSYFDLELLDGKDLFFADPMNATGGSLVTVVKYLLEQGVKPRSIKFFNVVSVLKGLIRIVRAIEDAEVYTLWVDPTLNRLAYIMPGLGDAGDRINGTDQEDNPRNIIQLIACYGSNIASLYRDQLREIEWTVLGK